MNGTPLSGRRILVVIAGGIAAYKALFLIRRLRQRGAEVRAILTRGGARFVTPLSVATLAGSPAYSDLFSLTAEAEMGHLRLAQWPDLIVVAPASADILARMAGGRASDLASATLLATNRPVLVAPAMNTRMWRHPATRRNMARLEADGVMRVGPAIGPLAEGESGEGRMAEPDEIVAAITTALAPTGPLAGRKALVTSGPTYEAIDPVRFIGNRSSGRQGHAIARAMARLGAGVVLVSGPTAEPDPPGVSVVRVESAEEMWAACREALPVDVAVCAAAVADWRPARPAGQKLKRANGARPNRGPVLDLVETPDILASLARLRRRRPPLVVGFAAETERVVAQAMGKLARKRCDWIVANDVSPERGVMGGERNQVHLIVRGGPGAAPEVESWPEMSKDEVAERLAARIADALGASRAPAPA